MRRREARSEVRPPGTDGPACDICGWSLRDSDRFCSLCGSLQRDLSYDPGALNLVSPQAAQDEAAPQPISPGYVTLRNAGSHSLRVLAIGPPAGVGIEPPIPSPEHGGLELPVGGDLRLEGKRSGEVVGSPSELFLRTSIGTLRLPVRTQPVPPLRLDHREFRVPRGQEMDVDCQLSLAEGDEWVQLEASGPGIELGSPDKPVRLEAGVPCNVVLRADARRCVRPEEPCRLIVQLADGARLAFQLTFEEATPGRLHLASGESFLSLRVFPGEPLRRHVELRNDGLLPYPIENASLSADAGGIFPELEPKLLDALEQPLRLPYEVPPGGSVLLRIDARAGAPPGRRQSGTLRIAGTDAEPFLLPILLDTREPSRHPFAVGLDFGTSASAVATRHRDQRQPGRILSIEFRPPDEEQARSDTYLPSDVQIVRHPERKGECEYEIDWFKPREERHLGFARNLKRRIGFDPEYSESRECVVLDGRLVEIPVEELAAHVIGEMKRQAERQLGARLDRAIATVPTRFSLRRVKAVREVYRLAGLPELHLIDEAVAAGILGMYNQFLEKPEYTMLVYDMGGGTTDVTLLHVENRRQKGTLEIRPRLLGLAGDARLGGRDITEWMMNQVLANLPPDERDSLPWPVGRSLPPELQKIALRNKNRLFLQAEEAKLKLFPLENPPVQQTLMPTLWDRDDKQRLFKGFTFSASQIEAAIRPQLQRLWREILDMIASSGVDTLHILYFAGRSSLLPFIHRGLPEMLTAEGRFPQLQVLFPQDRYGKTVLKEAVSLGACLALDLLDGIEEQLITEDLSVRSASRFGIRNQRGDFLEVLSPNWEIGKPSDKRLPIRLGSRLRGGRYEAHIEVWENPTLDRRIDDNPEAELVGVARLSYSIDEVGPVDPVVEVGLVMNEDRTLTLLALIGDDMKEVPIEP